MPVSRMTFKASAYTPPRPRDSCGSRKGCIPRPLPRAAPFQGQIKSPAPTLIQNSDNSRPRALRGLRGASGT